MHEAGTANLRFQTENLIQYFPDSDTPKLDAQVLLSHILNKSRAWIISHPEYELDVYQLKVLSHAISKLKNSVPLPYIIGTWEFYNLDLQINQEVLIPRPETEILVENAINWLKTVPEPKTGIDIGTGSGCIAISLLVNVSSLTMHAVDISETALAVADSNAAIHQVNDRISFIKSDLFSSITRKFDLIIANLPYIPTRVLHGLQVFGKEPSIALDGGITGFEICERFLSEAPNHLHSNGLLLMEIESKQGEVARKTAKKYFSGSEITLNSDLAGYDRILRIQAHEN